MRESCQILAENHPFLQHNEGESTVVNYKKIIEILNDNMVLASGCTEPGAIALTAAAAAEQLGETVETLQYHQKRILRRYPGHRPDRH